MPSDPITLRFSGDQVATYTEIQESLGDTTISVDETPFLSTDIFEITIDKDGWDNNTGEFDLSTIEYYDVRVMRDGIWYDLSSNTGAKVKATSGSETKEQGDSFFTTADKIGPSAAGTPFENIPEAQYAFATETTFVAGEDTVITIVSDSDFNNDGDTNDGEETGDGNFNVNFATNNTFASDAIIIDIDASDGTYKGTDYVVAENESQYVIITDAGDINSIKFANWGKDAATVPGEGQGGDDEFHINLAGFDDDFSITLASLDAGDTFFFTNVDSYSTESDPANDVLVYTINYTGSDGQPHTVTIDLFSAVTEEYVGIDITLACFAKGTMIETYHGPCAVEDLDLDDMILCGDGQHRPIQWMATRHISSDELELRPEFRPVRLRQDSMGYGLPYNDLVVSPQHRILVSDWRAELLFAVDEVLVPAKFMVNDKSIVLDHFAEEVTYYHFMFDEHQTVVSNGVESESFHPGDMALTGIDDAARDELYALFPELEFDRQSFGPTSHLVLKAYEAATLFATP